MTTDPTRAAEIVVEQAARLISPRSWQARALCLENAERWKDAVGPTQIKLRETYLADADRYVAASIATAKEVLALVQRPTDTARAGEAWPPSEQRWNDDLASIVEALWGASTANLIRAGKLNREEIKAKYALRDVILKYLQPDTPSPVTDETALSGEVDPVERAAIAIANAALERGDEAYQWAVLDEDGRNSYRDDARAALASTPPASAGTVEQAVAAERERCAKIADWVSTACTESSNYDGLLPADVADVIADKIRSTPSPVTDEALTDEVQRLIAIAYAAGCQAVHDNYQEDRDPDFSEAASDYARSIDLAALASTPQPAVAETVERAVEAERERCAKIAENHFADERALGVVNALYMSTSIAAAIRQSARGGE